MPHIPNGANDEGNRALHRIPGADLRSWHPLDHYKPGNSITYEAYSDADWQVAHSTTGTCHCVGGRVVHASSKRQQSISISTTEAEIMAASLAATEIVFMRGLLAEMGYDMSQPTVLWVDNQGQWK